MWEVTHLNIYSRFPNPSGDVKVCIRAFGPSRANSDALSDPQIELIQQASEFHTSKTTLAWNDGIISIMMIGTIKLQIPRHKYLHT